MSKIRIGLAIRIRCLGSDLDWPWAALGVETLLTRAKTQGHSRRGPPSPLIVGRFQLSRRCYRNRLVAMGEKRPRMECTVHENEVISNHSQEFLDKQREIKRSKHFFQFERGPHRARGSPSEKQSKHFCLSAWGSKGNSIFHSPPC